MIKYEKRCCFCGESVELGSFQGREQTLCRYGNCINNYNNCKYRVKNYLGHKHKNVRDFAKVVQTILDKKLPVIHYDSQLKLLALASRKLGTAKLPLIGTNRS